MADDKRVLIAGAGPVGCVAALILARAGVPVTLLEGAPSLPQDLRASTFHPPTLDMLAELGLAEPLLAIGLKAPSFQFRDRRSGERATFDLGCLAGDTNHPFRLQIEQFHLTGFAIEALARCPDADVRFDHPVRGYEQDGAGVSARAETPDGPVWLRGAYLIGADGASSAVRAAAGIAFEGFTYPSAWLVLSTDHDFGAHFPGLTWVNYVADPERWFVLLRVPRFWRVLMPIDAATGAEEALGEDLVQGRLQDIARRADAYPLAHRTLYRVHQRVAARYRAGRVLLAGDAAHINNPLGGMGMNGGIHDGVNLARKLVRILRDGADADRLLDHYGEQRRAIAIAYVQSHTHGNQQAIAETDPAARRARMDEMRRIADSPALLKPFVRKATMLDAVAGSMALDPDG